MIGAKVITLHIHFNLFIQPNMTLNGQLRQATTTAIKSLYKEDFEPEKIIINITPKEFIGDFTVVVFPIVKLAKKSPETVGNELGAALLSQLELVEAFNTVKGFLNLTISKSYWLEFLKDNHSNDRFGQQSPKQKKVVLEYCGPNTNKPLHLGHIRNMLLGYSVANILAFNGQDVVKANIYNDRGIAICKSMVAWLRRGNGETPESSGIKGDLLVGTYYVLFENIYKEEIKTLIADGLSEDEAKEQAAVMIEARQMLLKWEANDPDTIALWKKMNGWVYEGFNNTFKKIGVDFEANYYESETYIYGKSIVKEGLDNGSFIKKEDGSVWVDLSKEGLDEKILLRSDGTSVYLTQDLGTAQLRYADFNMDQSIYVVANEQDYHFNVLKLTLQKLGKPYADGIHHLSYGMVDLPSGKMKSREGTVVDADELIDEMLSTAEKHTKSLGKIEDFSEEEGQKLYQQIGLAALKFFMLRVDPKKRMLFNPKESIDFHGQTGPFVQYTYARIQSILRKSKLDTYELSDSYELQPLEKEVLVLLHEFPNIAAEAARDYSPATIANYTYLLAKTFNQFYAQHSILSADAEEEKQLRLALASFVAKTIKTSLDLLGIEVPERM